MKFGERVREIRRARKLTLRVLAAKVNVNFTYLSKIENGKLDFGDYPSEVLICKLAQALEADADELLILARKIPERIRVRIMERPDAFLKLASLDDQQLDRVLGKISSQKAEGNAS